jgi:protein SCO1/2
MRRVDPWLLSVACLLVLSCGGEPGQVADVATPLETPPLEDYGGIGGDFSLSDQRGEPFELESLRGRPAMLFFGYTYCPDICPVTLSKMSRVFEILGASGQDMATLFITVDPERDTRDKLAQYLDYFGLDTIGLRGSKQETDRVIGQYGGHYALNKEQGETDYFVDHSTTTYLIDQEGRIRFLFGQSDTPELMAAVTRQLLPTID